jgi:hypothetical protein
VGELDLTGLSSFHFSYLIPRFCNGTHRANQFAPATTVAEVRIHKHLSAGSDDGAELAHFVTPSAQIALFTVDVRKRFRYGYTLRDGGLQENVSVRFFNIAIQVGDAPALAGSEESEVGGHRRLPCAALPACYGNPHRTFIHDEVTRFLGFVITRSRGPL